MPRLRDDHGMAVRASVFQDHPDKVIEVHREQVEHRGFVSHQDDLLRRGSPGSRLRPQVPQDTPEHVLDIEDSFLEKRVGETLERRDIFLERPRQGGLGTGSPVQATVQVAVDRAVLKDHELRLQDGAVILAHQVRDAPVSRVISPLRRLHRLVETFAFHGGIGCGRDGNLGKRSTRADQVGLTQAGTRRQGRAAEPLGSRCALRDGGRCFVLGSGRGHTL